MAEPKPQEQLSTVHSPVDEHSLFTHSERSLQAQSGPKPPQSGQILAIKQIKLFLKNYKLSDDEKLCR